MKSKNKISGILKTFANAEKLKSVLRCAYTSGGKRKESSADHSWMTAFLAVVLFREVKLKVDQPKVLKMVIVHDLAEAIAGDSYPWDAKKRINKRQREKNALKKIVAELPRSSAQEIFSLWREYERMDTVEAKFAKAIDKLEVLFQHNAADIKTWLPGDFEINPYWKDEYFNIDTFLRALKDKVDLVTMNKIIRAGMLSKVRPEHVKRFRKSKKSRND